MEQLLTIYLKVLVISSVWHQIPQHLSVSYSGEWGFLLVGIVESVGKCEL